MNTITVYRENYKEINVTLTQNSVPVNITGYTFYFTVRKQLLNEDSDDSDAIIKKDVTSHSDPVNGETKFVLQEIDTNITPKTYYYDVTFKDTSNKVRTVDVGYFIIEGNTTGRAK